MLKFFGMIFILKAACILNLVVILTLTFVGSLIEVNLNYDFYRSIILNLDKSE